MKHRRILALVLVLLVPVLVFAQAGYLTSGQTVVATWLSSGKTAFVALTAQTGADAYLTVPDFAGVADEFTFKTKAQTLSNKTFVALTYAIALDVGTANVAKVTFNIDSDQTATSASIVWTARTNGLVVIS